MAKRKINTVAPVHDSLTDLMRVVTDAGRDAADDLGRGSFPGPPPMRTGRGTTEALYQDVHAGLLPTEAVSRLLVGLPAPKASQGILDVPVDDRSVHNPNSPTGQIEQTAALADRLTRLTNRRREIPRSSVVICFALPAIVFLISAFAH